MTPEQEEELEVLRSIYAESLQEISSDPPSVRLSIDSGFISTGAVRVSALRFIIAIALTVTFPENYPHEIPEISLDCVRGKYPEIERLKGTLLELASRSLGMAMVYSLMSTIEETLTSYNLDLAKSKPLLQAKRQEEISERQKFEGTPLTVERFHEWNAKFMQEMKRLREEDLQTKEEPGPKKLTGKQLFEQHKALATSDSAFYTESGANADEDAFEGLEDLDIDSDRGRDSGRDSDHDSVASTRE